MADSSSILVVLYFNTGVGYVNLRVDPAHAELKKRRRSGRARKERVEKLKHLDSFMDSLYLVTFIF